MKHLVIAEKPSVGRDIARVLSCGKKNNSYMEGENYIVTWALGHLVTLADPEEYGSQPGTVVCAFCGGPIIDCIRSI